MTSKANSETQAQSDEPTPQDLKNLNARLKRISDSVIQRSPYILTVPSERPYRRDPRHANDWRHGTPFEEHEEELQYVSFLRDWDDGLIRPVGGWDDDNGELVADHAPRSSASNHIANHHPRLGSTSANSGTSTPNPKKISLSDYKKKATTKPTDGASQTRLENGEGKPAADKVAQMKRPYAEPDKVKKHDRDTLRSSPAFSDTSPQKHDHVRDRSRSAAPPDGSPRKRNHHLDAMRSSPAASDKSPKKHRDRSRSAVRDLPPMLSPTLPPAIENALPPMLSPTLPPALERELSRGQKPEQRQRASTNSSSDQPLDNSQKHQKSEKSDKKLPAKPVEPAKSSLKHLPEAVNGSKPHKSEGASKKPLSKIVRLKIPKTKRRDFERLVRLASGKKPKPAPAAKSGLGITLNESDDDRRTNKAGEKRPRHLDDDGSPEIRPKKSRTALNHEHAASKPSTPAPGGNIRSPAISHHGSAQKGRVSTPQPDNHRSLLSVADHDGAHVSTPRGMMRNGTPTAPDSADRSKRNLEPTSAARPSSSASSTVSAAKKEEMDTLTKQAHDFYTLGRVLKRETRNDDDEDGGGGSSSKRRRRLANAIESILCFMLSYAVRDELHRLRFHHRPSAPREESWSTIFPYLHNVRAMARNTSRPMRGLLLQLEAVCHLSILAVESERSAALAKHESAAGGSGGSGGGGGGGGDKPSAGAPEAGTVLKHFAQATTLLRDAAAELGVEQLQLDFPRTWKRRSGVPLTPGGGGHAGSHSEANGSGGGGGVNKFDPAGDGEFFLPISSFTSGVEAVRAGLALLSEWCRTEDVDWTQSLGRKGGRK